ncbi:MULTISPECIES: hypothetical protein [unclassified Moraxella]|uniref:hypothetical protein n=1 Tax=unclassified Moraxella TaxID=2685852 RepID=UPI00359DC086
MKKTKLPLFYWVLLLVIGVVVGLFAKMYDESASQVNTISRDGIITDIQKLSRLQSVAFSIDTDGHYGK